MVGYHHFAYFSREQSCFLVVLMPCGYDLCIVIRWVPTTISFLVDVELVWIYSKKGHSGNKLHYGHTDGGNRLQNLALKFQNGVGKIFYEYILISSMFTLLQTMLLWFSLQSGLLQSRRLHKAQWSIRTYCLVSRRMLPGGFSLSSLHLPKSTLPSMLLPYVQQTCVKESQLKPVCPWCLVYVTD